MVLLGVIIASHFGESIVPVDQNWSIKLSTGGYIDTPAGKAQDFALVGDVSLAKVDSKSTNAVNFRLQLKLKRSQNNLLSFFTESFPDEKNSATRTSGAFKVDGYAIFINTCSVRTDENRVEEKPTPSVNDVGDYQSSAMLTPLNLTVGVVQRALNSPDLLTEYYIGKDGPREFFVNFKRDLNTAIDPSSGDAAFKFVLKMKNGNEVIPKLMEGSLKVNSQSRKAIYISAGSNSIDWAPESRESILGGIESISIRMDLKS
ncbi:MAG TPA: hypothetical protein VK171_10065 [Fimbriimonas sp.]|nr:hypothetical protein [Fimbriimonas sp.]